VLELYGDKLASVAQDEARTLAPERKGLRISVIEAAVLASGHTIRGDDRVTLGSALNGAHHRFDRVGTGTWAWKETESIEGLTASALLDEAYLTAKRIDPERHGVHYEVLKDAIVADGARIAGGRPGNTLFTVLKGAKQWFEALGNGFFRWR
jgi:hypothetical protein